MPQRLLAQRLGGYAAKPAVPTSTATWRSAPLEPVQTVTAAQHHEASGASPSYTSALSGLHMGGSVDAVSQGGGGGLRCVSGGFFCSRTRLGPDGYKALATSSRGFAASAVSPSPEEDDDPIGRSRARREVLAADEAARRVMADPMSRLMASQGMPVGLSLGPKGDAAAGAAGDGSDDAASGRSSSSGSASTSGNPAARPAYDMEAFSDMLRATAASARRDPYNRGHARTAADADPEPLHAQTLKAPAPGAAAASGDGLQQPEPAQFGVQSVSPSMADAWGTTQESPADIARRIAESNLCGPEAGGQLEDDGDELVDGQMSSSEAKYASLESMSADIKKLDEVFEVLASVPWLDEDSLAEKELKGVATVGLLGTLEEVGFNIRPQVLRIWAGERGAELASIPGLEARDQAALIAILFHTKQIEDKHGPPPKGYSG